MHDFNLKDIIRRFQNISGWQIVFVIEVNIY